MAHSGKEIEIKLRVASAADAARRLEAAGFQIVRPRVFEINHLLDDAAGSLLSRGEALRVRERGGETILTYKGPPEAGRHKIREEIETGITAAAPLLNLLARLGFAPTYRYEKFRTEFARPGEPGVATVDETPIGVFMELEGGPDWIDQTAAELGFPEMEFIQQSYATLFHTYCQAAGRDVGRGMTFTDSRAGA